MELVAPLEELGTSGPGSDSAVADPSSCAPGSAGAKDAGAPTSQPLDVPAAVLAARQQLQGRPERDAASGRFVGGTAAALGPGHHSKQLQEALAPLRDAVCDATLTDLGVSRLVATQTQLMAARDLATLDVISETLWAFLQEHGPLTAKGKSRAALGRLLAVLDRKANLIKLLGLERRGRQVKSIADVIRPGA
jgi:hypothetical protein